MIYCWLDFDIHKIVKGTNSGGSQVTENDACEIKRVHPRVKIHDRSSCTSSYKGLPRIRLHASIPKVN